MKFKVLIVGLVFGGLMVATTAAVMASHILIGPWEGRTTEGRPIHMNVSADDNDEVEITRFDIAFKCPSGIEFVTGGSAGTSTIRDNGRFSAFNWSGNSFMWVRGRFNSPFTARGTIQGFWARDLIPDEGVELCWSPRVKWIATPE